MPARIWAFVQTKGGSGKSTLATNIAVQAEEAGEAVLLVDLDAQSSASLWGSQRGSKKPTVFEGRPEKLAEIIKSAATLGVELIIIDTPSKTDAVQLAAIRAADLVICPVMVDLFSLAGLQDTARLIDMAGKLAASVAVVNNLDETGAAANMGEAQAVLKAIRMPMSPTPVWHRPAYTAAIGKGLSVTELGAKQKAAADEIRALWAFPRQAREATAIGDEAQACEGGSTVMRNKGQARHRPGVDRETLVDKLTSWGRGRSAQPDTPPQEAPAYPIPPSRRTKKTFTAWADKDALAQLKRLAEHRRMSQQKLIAEAFNLLFEKHGLPPIAT